MWQKRAETNRQFEALPRSTLQWCMAKQQAYGHVQYA